MLFFFKLGTLPKLEKYPRLNEVSSLITNLIIVEDLVTSFDTVARDTENHESVQHSCAVEAGGGAPSSVGRHPRSCACIAWLMGRDAGSHSTLA